MKANVGSHKRWILNLHKFFVISVCLGFLCSLVSADIDYGTMPAFPGAEGSGMWATGGRGGDVYIVTNLTNDANTGSGSIVDALSEPNRTVVFAVSGTIELNGVKLYPKSNTTIAGQTAPGDGICIKGRIHLKSNVHDIVIRHIRVRVDEGAKNSSGDAIDIDSCYDVIIDHVTASYSRDEGISCQEDSNNITVQWCIISESLNYESHSYGSLIRGAYGQKKTYHHNLYAHNKSRNPRPGNYLSSSVDTVGLYFDFRNNVIYNWSGNYAGYNDDTSMISRYNIIGNAFIPGPNSTSKNGYKGFREKSKYSYGYFRDNSYDGEMPSDPWSIVYFYGLSDTELAAYKARSYRLSMDKVTTTSPAQATTDVLADAGASFPSRDVIDTRIVNDVINKTGTIILTTADQPEGAWPTLESDTAPTDTDADGMPDDWENKYNLDPNDSNDRNDCTLNGCYTNLEVYLASLVGDNIVAYMWSNTYDGTLGSNDYAIDMAADADGNVYVTGYAKNSSTNYDFVTIKYNSDGNAVWTKKYNRSYANNEYAEAIAIDANSNIIVAGYGYTSFAGYDGIIVKYNSAGTQLWARAFNTSGTNEDIFYDVVADSNGSIYAVGTTADNWLVVRYSSAGTLLWSRTYNGSGKAYDALYQAAIDNDGNLYACGQVAQTDGGYDCATVKYASDGTMLWLSTYDYIGTDMLESIALDPNGYIYVTGSSDAESGCDYITMKYSLDGELSWLAFYSGTDYGIDAAMAVTLCPDGGVAVTGYSTGEDSVDAATVKYDAETGEELWVQRYDGLADSTDYTRAIASDRFSNIYVHGESIEFNSRDYLTICYDANGTMLWRTNYDGAAGLKDIGTAMAVVDGGDSDVNSSIYVTGCSQASASDYDYLTLKYTVEYPDEIVVCAETPMGDLTGDCMVNFFDFTAFAEDYTASQQDWITIENIADTWLDCNLTEQDDCWK